MLGCTGPVFGQNVRWLIDVPAAKEQAKRENKFVLLDFTGSDWCGWCIKLKAEVFDQRAFAEFAKSNLVLVEVDFPHHKLMTMAQKDMNGQLAATYHVTGYPTIVVLDQDGQQAGRLGYVEGGPGAFLKELERVAKISARRGMAAQEASRKPVPWTPPPPPPPIHYGPLSLKGISGTKERRMVLINNASLMAGETAKVRTEWRDVVVCCKEIREDSVLITCDGEPMELKLARH